MVLYDVHGAVVQLGERLHGMQEVAGSSPVSSSFNSNPEMLKDSAFPGFSIYEKRLGDFGVIYDKTKFQHEGDEIYAMKPQLTGFYHSSMRGIR